MNGPNYNDISCAAVEILLTEYEARELDPAEVAVVETHLETCAECRAELAREKFLRGTLADLPVVPCPQKVTAKIMAATQDQAESAEPQPESRRLGRVLSWAAAAAAVVLIMTSPMVGDRSSHDPGQLAVHEFTPEEIQAARQDAQRGLLLTARILNRTERATVKEVFGHTLPESLSRPIKSLINTPEGGQG